MIFYFSGTGNSKWVAKQIAAGTGDEALNIVEFLKNDRTDISAGDGGCVGFVFPNHAWGTPKPVIQFSKNIGEMKGLYHFVVCTCGISPGYGMKRFSQSFPLDGAWSIVMPNTCITMFELDSEELIQKKIETAQSRIPDICRSIRSRQSIWDVNTGVLPYLKSYAVNPLFQGLGLKYVLNAQGFAVGDSCDSCALCEQVCPMENITLKDGRPVWSDNCIQCLACIHRCPVRAIEYRKLTQSKGRYTFELFYGSIEN
jgi:ferredoxin